MSEKKQAPKKQVRNKGRDTIVDYYKTNREITKEYDELYKKQKQEAKESGKKREWTSTEKTYLVIIAIGVLLIAVKYLVF